MAGIESQKRSQKKWRMDRPGRLASYRTGSTQVISHFDIFALVQDMFYRHILQAHGGAARTAAGDGYSMPSVGKRPYDEACGAFLNVRLFFNSFTQLYIVANAVL